MASFSPLHFSYASSTLLSLTRGVLRCPNRLQGSKHCCQSSSEKLEEDVDSVCSSSILPPRNTSRRRSRIRFLRPDASSGLNHFLSNYLSQGQKIIIKKILKTVYSNIYSALWDLLPTIARSFFLSLSGASLINLSMKYSTKRPQSYSFFCWGTW